MAKTDDEKQAQIAGLEAVARGAFEAWLKDACSEVIEANENMSFNLYLQSPVDDGPSVNLMADLPEDNAKNIEKRIWWEVTKHAEAVGLQDGDFKNRANEGE